MLEKAKLKIKPINLGLQVLRLFLCLWIVIIHCSIIKKAHKKYSDKGFHVPTFILMSFYFFYRTLFKRSISKIISRFQRLIIPYIIWPIIIFFLYRFLYQCLNLRIASDNLKINDIYLQLLIGSRYHGVFWFQFNLIFLSLFFVIISLIFKIYFLNIFKIFGALSLYFQISEINYRVFRNFNSLFSKNIGSLFELLPIAVVGLILGSKRLLLKIEQSTFIFYFFMVFSIYILFEYDIFIIKQGFRYSNILLNLFGSLSLFMTFGSLPFKQTEKCKLLIVLNNITKFTGGIYYIHPIIRDFLRKISSYFDRKRNYYNSFIIYFISYFVCFIGAKLFSNYQLKYNIIIESNK